LGKDKSVVGGDIPDKMAEHSKKESRARESSKKMDTQLSHFLQNHLIFHQITVLPQVAALI
jgi:hypothetical protein